MNRRTRHAWHDLHDFLDRNADMIPLLAILVLLPLIGLMCAGSPDDGRGYLDSTTPPPQVVDAVPGSPVLPGSSEVGP